MPAQDSLAFARLRAQRIRYDHIFQSFICLLELTLVNDNIALPLPTLPLIEALTRSLRPWRRLTVGDACFPPPFRGPFPFVIASAAIANFLPRN